MSCALQRACASKNIGTRKSGVPTYRIRSRQLLRIHRVFLGAVTGTAGTLCGRENALRSCIDLAASVSYLVAKINIECAGCGIAFQPIGSGEMGGLLQLTLKYLENYCAIDHPLQRIGPRAAAKHNYIVYSGERRFREQCSRFQIFCGSLSLAANGRIPGGRGVAIRNVCCAVGPGAVRTRCPGNPRLARRIKPEQRDPTILSK